MTIKRVAIWTGGACSGNPGPGWGAILRFGDREKELCGGEAFTTNNRMELMAAIMALEALTRPCAIDLFTDSQYLRGGVTGWISAWKARGWRTADKKPVKNIDLWQRLEKAEAQHDVHWHWVKGHAGHEMNERADELARKGLSTFRIAAATAAKPPHVWRRLSVVPDFEKVSGTSGIRWACFEQSSARAFHFMELVQIDVQNLF